MSDEPVWERLEPLYGPFIKAFADLNAFVELVWPEADSEFPPNINQTMRFFVRTMFSRARAAFLLLQAGSYWESEIVLRSLLEASVRCATFARRKDVEMLLHEFWVELQSSSDRKSALKAALAHAIISPESTDNRVFAALQDPQFFSIEPQSNKQRRRKLDQEWSLPELVRKLQDPSETVQPIVGLDAMFHGYGLQSEVLHVSAKYYDLLWDRMLRKDDLKSLEDTHYCRQMTDAVQLTSVSIMFSLRRLGLASKQVTVPIEIANSFSELTRPYQEAFDRSQGFA